MKLVKRLFEPADVFPLVLFRILFGAIMSWEAYRYLSHQWVEQYYMRPVFFFTYYGFGWVHPWPGDWMWVHFYVLEALAVCVAIGFCYRIASALFFLGFTYVFLLDQTQYLNHFYLICLLSLLLACVPAHRLLSVDAWLRPKLRSDTAPAWALWLLRIQVGLPYFFGGIAKMNVDWLHGRPLDDWLREFSGAPVIGGLLLKHRVVLLAAWGSLALDLLMFPLLLWPRTRNWALGAAILFHLANSQLFQIGVFPWMMIAGTAVLFLPPEVLRRFFKVPRMKPAPPVAAPVRVQPAIGAAVIAYLTLQVLVPLRWMLYPGNVSWTEEGHLFAWHMKLRDKDASVDFTVTDPATGQAWTVDAGDYLTPRQRLKMNTRPDMILQFCHFLAERARAEGKGKVEVRVKAIAAMNGRRAQHLIDPAVDLAAQPRTWKTAAWIVPLRALPVPQRQAEAIPAAANP
jgi:hypothetical protein